MSEDIRRVLTGQQWEVTKGHLNACLANVGCARLTCNPASEALDESEVRYDMLKRLVANFVHTVETLELCC